MKQYSLTLIVCCILVSACSVASLQQQEKPQTSQHSQNSQQEQIVPQQKATPPEDEDKQIYEIPEGVKKHIEFKRGRRNTTLTGRIVRMSFDQYILEATAGQRMTVTIKSVEDNAVFDVYSNDNKNLTGDGDQRQWTGELILHPAKTG